MRVHRGHIAVHADTCHEADTHVNVGVVESPCEAAGEVPKLPVVPVYVVVDPKGKNAKDDDVRHRQVADVDTEGRAVSDLKGEDEKGCQVTRQTHKQGEDVDGRE